MTKRAGPRIPEVDVGELRRELGLTVEEFAQRYGMTPCSLRNWEAGTSQPFRMAKVLLAIIAARPEVVDEALGISKAKADRSWRAFPDA